MRCVYRIPELLGGWGNSLMRVESEFIGFESWMIVLCVAAQTICHPGIFFPVMGNGSSKQHAASKLDSETGDGVEMMRRERRG